VAALGVNCVVGSGIFLLPGPVASRLASEAAPVAVAMPVVATVGAGALACLIALCFAEVASRFRETGGAYLYTREAFGELAGFEVGWLSALAGVVAWGALVNGFAVALGRLVPAVAEGPGHTAAIVGLLLVLAWLNLLGARSGGGLSTVASGVKLATLVGFVAAGFALAGPGSLELAAPAGDGAALALPRLPAAILLMLYAYVGFENLVVPAGEMDRPERSLPLAITGVLATVTLLYSGVMAVVAGTLFPLAGRDNAVAASAEALFGPAGGMLVAGAVVVSVVGVNAASALILPRRLSALADRGDLPAVVGRLDAKHGSPRVALVVSYGLAGVVALSGSFAELAALAVVGRLMQYIPTCLAVLVFRRRDRRDRQHRQHRQHRQTTTGDPAHQPGAGAARFRVPGGPAVPLLALGLAVALLLQATPGQLAAGALAAVAALPLYAWSRRGRVRPASRPPSGSD